MPKDMKIEEHPAALGERLAEIRTMTFADLSDDDILGILAERKRLEELQAAYEKRKREDEELRLQEKKDAARRSEEARKKDAFEKKIAELNRSISPDKPDDELLALIAHRKELEAELAALGGDDVSADFPNPGSAVAAIREGTSPPESSGSASLGRNVVSEEDLSTNILPEKPPEETEDQREGAGFKKSLKEDFGREGIVPDDLEEGGELHRYLDQLKNNTGSLGTLLQEMPLDARRNRAFMLKVAEIDPAYAMHYADSATLKRDENFNIRIASMANARNSGNPLAEMLPEARTSKVVLAGVKQDYRNIKFIRPEMEAYDEMMNIAKKVALEKIRDLKDAADIMLLIPRPLQQDTEFMAEVKKITAGEKNPA